MKDVMIDVETLGLRTSAVVLSIGAVAFDPHGDEISEPIHLVMGRWDSQMAVGRTVDEKTLRFWMAQNQKTREAVLADSPDVFAQLCALRRAVHGWCGAENYDKVRWWGNGADFDLAILDSLAADFMGKPCFSEYKMHRCYRTMKAEFPSLPLERYGNLHNAADDAVTQAKHLQKLYKRFMPHES